MTRKYKFLVGILMFFIAAFFLFPGRGFAIDFTIPNVKIDAYLEENGDAKVKETFTYSFEDDFNGITRTIVPKKGSKITDLRAEERGKKLKVEKDESLYSIHRKGKSDETITIDIFYTIKNATSVYKDVGDFYWPFFDDRNEADYEDYTVTVHPPTETDEVIAFGYDEAFNTEAVQKDGSVIFKLGEVPSGKKGDIRVAYDATLFPTAKKANTSMKDGILEARQALIDKAEIWAERKELFDSIGSILIPAMAVFFLFIITQELVRQRLKKDEVQRNIPTTFTVPKEKITLPATIYFTYGTQLSGEAMAAAFLDLVRRGFVSRTADDRFQIARPLEGLKKHEQQLLTFLFEEVGQNGEFRFADLDAYTKAKKNHETYYKNQLEWQNDVRHEVKQSGLYERKVGLRWLLGLGSIILLPFLIIFPIFDSFGLFMGTLLLLMFVLGFAFFYWPKSFDGLMIYHEWTALKERLQDLPEKVWQSLSEEEQVLLYLYALGSKENRFVKNEEMIGYFELPPSDSRTSNFAGGVDISMMFALGPIAATNFHTAHDKAQSTMTATSSSSGVGGGGVGGGGGGSGAF